MGTEVTSVKARLAARRENMAERIAGLGGGSSNLIRVKNRAFTLPDGTVVQKRLRGIVLGWNYFYQYYKEAYNPNKPQFPDCFAIGDVAKNLAPSDNSPEKQNDVCATCQWNQWGSSSTGAGKACQNRVQIAFQIAEHGPDSDILRISVSPTGLKNWREYVEALAAKKADPVQVVTEFFFDDSVSYDRLMFRATAKTDQSELKHYAANFDQAEQMLATEPTPPSDEDDDE
jgi:hypothetical protein